MFNYLSLLTKKILQPVELIKWFMSTGVLCKSGCAMLQLSDVVGAHELCKQSVSRCQNLLLICIT
jgi:hypothetical protein